MTMKLHICRTADGANFPLPSYSSKYHSALNLQAGIPNVMKLNSGERIYIPIGFSIGIPEGYCAMIVSMPTTAKEKGLIVLGGPQLIHPADREPIFILIQNVSQQQQILRRGDLIAQLVIVPCQQVCWNEIAPHGSNEVTSVEKILIDDQKSAEQPVEKTSSRREIKSVRDRVKGKK